MEETSRSYLDTAIVHDDALVKAALNGDFGAFDALVDRNWRKVASVGRAFLQDPNEVDDAVQETFIKAFEHLHSFRGTASLQTWLMRIAVNVCKNRRRSFWSRWVTLGTGGDSGDNMDRADRSDMAGWSLGGDSLESSLHAREVRAMVDRLPDNIRLPIQMHYFEEMKGAEIAAVLGWNESTVWSRIYAGCKILRKSLASWNE